jgi:hypothetical protein
MQCRVAVYYFRSRLYDLGDALCWVDDNEKGAVTLPGYWTKEYNTAKSVKAPTTNAITHLGMERLTAISSVAYIDRNVTTGDHL